MLESYPAYGGSTGNSYTFQRYSTTVEHIDTKLQKNAVGVGNNVDGGTSLIGGGCGLVQLMRTFSTLSVLRQFMIAYRYMVSLSSQSNCSRKTSYSRTHLNRTIAKSVRFLVVNRKMGGSE